jgi:hypothetical protein
MKKPKKRIRMKWFKRAVIAARKGVAEAERLSLENGTPIAFRMNMQVAITINEDSKVVVGARWREAGIFMPKVDGEIIPKFWSVPWMPKWKVHEIGGTGEAKAESP